VNNDATKWWYDGKYAYDFKAGKARVSKMKLGKLCDNFCKITTPEDEKKGMKKVTKCWCAKGGTITQTEIDTENT